MIPININNVKHLNKVIMGSIKGIKFELALSDDLKAGAAFLQTATESVKKSIANYENSYKAMQTESNGAKSVLSTQQKLINSVEAKAKDLGINPSTIPNYNEINKNWEITSAIIDKVNQF